MFKVFDECFMEVLRVFQGSFKVDSRKFFRESFKGGSRKIEE